MSSSHVTVSLCLILGVSFVSSDAVTGCVPVGSHRAACGVPSPASARPV